MNSQKKSIDEIWKELNASKPKPRQGVAGLAVGLSGLPGVVSSVRSKPASSAPLAQQPASNKPSDFSTGHYLASAVGDDAASYLSSLQRTINCLADPDRGLRRTAATTLQTKLFIGDASTPKASPAQLQELLCGPLLRPLVNMLSDSVERCRIVALNVLLDGGKQLSDTSPLLPELIPALARRFGALPVQEPAEEVRLQISQLVAQLLAAAPAAQLARFAPDLAAVVCRSLEDGFPDIKKAGCAAIETATGRLPFDALAPEVERLLTALVPNLQHQHSRVRLSSIQALDALVRAGAPICLVESTVVPALRPVGHDRAQHVREAAFTTLALWMGHPSVDAVAAAPLVVPDSSVTHVAIEDGSATCANNSEASSSLQKTVTAGVAAPEAQPATSLLRPQSYVSLLLPLLIVGVTDPQPATADLALRLLEGVGEAWAADAATTSPSGFEATATMADTVPRVQEVDPSVAVHAQMDQDRRKDSEPAPVPVPVPDLVWDGNQTPTRDDDDDDYDGSAGDAGRATQIREPTSRAAEVVSDLDKEESAVAARVAACRLGPPYTGRPRAGCRAMGRAMLAQHLPPLVRQLGEWTSALRVAAARALHTTLVLAEDGAERHLKLLLPAMCSAIADEELEVATYVVGSVHVLGAHVAPVDWLPLILNVLSDGGGSGGDRAQVSVAAAGLSLSQRTHTLVVLSGLLHAAARARRELPPPLLARLASVLAGEPMLMAAAEHAGVQQQLLAVTVNTLAIGGGACAGVALPLHVVLLQLYGSELAAAAAASLPPTPLQSSRPLAPALSSGVGVAVLDAMGSLAAACGYGKNGGAASLVDLHVVQLISLLFGEEEATAASVAAAPALAPHPAVEPSMPWRPQSGDTSWQCILRATLLTSSPQMLQRLAPELVSALHPLVGDKEREATLRLALLQLMDSVIEDPHRGPALATGGGQALLTEVLLPPLVWQAGKTAAAVRYAAVTALATLLGKRLPLPEHVLAAIQGPAATAGVGGGKDVSSGLLPMLFSALDEDWYTDMRLAACYVTEQMLEMVGPQLSDASRRAIYPELHKRLDDAHNSVRVAACGALRAFVTTAGSSYCDTNTGYLVAGVVIHMDDGDSAVQEAACGVLLAAAAVKPDVTAREVTKVRDRFRSKHYCDRVLAACAAARCAAAATGSEAAAS